MGDPFLYNLLVNAIKYSNEGGNVIITTSVTDDKTAPTVSISVKDVSCGIARGHLPRLLECFYRSDQARGQDAGGTGLGLAIVKHIVQAHGGTAKGLQALGIATILDALVNDYVEDEGSEFIMTFLGEMS